MMKTKRTGFILTFVVVFALALIFSLVFGEDNLLVAALSALAFAVIFAIAYIGMATRLDQTSSESTPPAGPSTPSSQLTEEDLSSVASKTVSNRDEPAKKEQKKAESSGPGGSTGEGYGGVPALDDHYQEPPKPHKPTQRPSPPPAPPPSLPPSEPMTSKDSKQPEEKADIIDDLILSQQEVEEAPPAETEAIPSSTPVITERRRSKLDTDEEDKPVLEPNPEVAEEVQFTLYHPKEVAPSKWYTLLTYVHILDALESVQQDAHKFRAEMSYDPREVKSRKTAKLMRGTELRLVPSAEGIEFNPPDLKLTWVEDYHRASFRFKASSDILGEPAIGEVAIYVGPLEIATIRFSIFVTDTPIEGDDESQQTAQAAMYKRIFASYSHRDTAIVKACVAAFKSIGYDVLIDYETLRSGEIWSADLERMIDEADIFQLFWSPNSASSKYVRQEWERALSRTYGRAPGEGFIRPVYWLQPMPNVPDELGHLHFKFMEDLATLNDEQGS